MPFLHLPLQSGADRILAAMNRKHTAATIWRSCTPPRRAARPALSSDFIVGFPGETEDEFGATLQMVSGSGSRRRTRSSTARAPARRPPPWPGSCRTRSRASGCIGCKICSRGNKRRSIQAAWGASCRCCSSGRGGTPDRSWGGRPTCKPFMQMRIWRSLGGSSRLRSRPSAPTAWRARTRGR